MPRFMILYKAVEPSLTFMANSSPEQIQAGMDAWMKWKEEATRTIDFEFGMPLQAIANVKKDAVQDSDSKVSGYSIIEGESKELVIEALKDHPHLTREGASIDVLEMVQPNS